MGAIAGLILQKLLVPALAALGERLIAALFGWLQARDEAAHNVALGRQEARADVAEGTLAINSEIDDVEARLRARTDDELRRRLSEFGPAV